MALSGGTKIGPREIIIAHWCGEIGEVYKAHIHAHTGTPRSKCLPINLLNASSDPEVFGSGALFGAPQKWGS
jgi:hypothetical protein